MANPIDKQKLRDAASKATPGPWSTRAERNCPRAIVIAGTEQIADAGNHTHWTDEQCAHNATFIAAASPSTVLPLLDENERLRKLARESVDIAQSAIANQSTFGFVDEDPACDLDDLGDCVCSGAA